LSVAGTSQQCYSCNNKDGAGQGFVENPKDCVSFRNCQADEVTFAYVDVYVLTINGTLDDEQV